MFSSPLVWIVKDSQNGIIDVKESDVISYQDEFPRLLRSLKKFDKNIRYKKIVGTKENLEEMFQEKPMILQFSGHGMVEENGKQHMIILEHNQGCSYYLQEDTLKDMLKSSNCQIQLAFILSCYSERTAFSFFKAGAKHVIGIRGDYEVSNEAASLFSELLYKYLLN